MEDQHLNQEISLKDVLLVAKEYISELWNKKWYLILFTVPVVSYFAYYGYKDTPKYKASINFIINDGGASSGLSSLLGSFGLPGTGKINLPQILKVSKSRNAAVEVLFSKMVVDTLGEKPDYIANHLIVLASLDKAWEKSNKAFANFRFKSDDIKSFSPIELTALKSIYGFFLDGNKENMPVLATKFEKDSGIVTFDCITSDEKLSVSIAEGLYAYIAEFYSDQKTKSPNNSVKFVEAKKDSITSLLRAKQYQLARFNDSHRNLIDPTLLADKKMIETEIQKLTLMYGEVTKNYEMAAFSLESANPDISLIETPLLPLDNLQKSWISEAIKGFMISIALWITWFIGRKLLLDTLK
jgi:hypothetical protein